MKKTLLAVTAITLALSAGSALSADLPSSKGPVEVPPPPPLWIGFYAGLNAGGTFGGGAVDVTHLDARPDPAASAAL